MQYDPFQLKSIQAIDEEKSVLVSAPTGAGKTAIAEYAINKAFARGERVIYTAPIKALSNQKYRDFAARYGDNVGILTGDVSINPKASLIIMTTEIYRNQLFEDPERLRQTSWVIFDEVHYLDDLERGTVWEEAIMFTPDHVRLLALSATAPNIEELAAWIRSILNHPIDVVIETHRPVPLVNLFQCNNVIFDDAHSLKKNGYLNRDIWPGRRDTSRMHGRRQFSRGQRFERTLRAKPNRPFDLVMHVLRQKRLPCLYFAFGRRRAEELAWEHKSFDFLEAKEKTEILALFDRLAEKYELAAEPSAIKMRELAERGIAFHHAGMLPTLKELVEQLFTSKLIKLIFTTETFALGINMPAKSVVFDEMRKFYGTHFGFLRTRDYFQMAGRAGRRGMDDKGFVYCRVNPHEISHSTVIRILYGKPESIESQFNSCYATLLNLYAQFGEKLLEIYPRSLHYYQSNKHGRQKGQAAIEKKLGLLRDMKYISGDKLTPKGEFASWMYGYELLLSELLTLGVLESLNEAQLAVLLCAMVFEPRKQDEAAPKLPNNFSFIAKRAHSELRRIQIKEADWRIYPVSKIPYFHMSAAIEAWVGGCLFSELERHTDTDEGEIIRYFRMVVQLLRQIRLAPQVSPKLRQTAVSALQKINRDLVDAERQLRNT